jgi:formate hydrogenlyase subunit 3/multisubunit Na+/H+ antiporter MnhD subunit
MQFSTSPAYDRLLTADRNFHVVFLVVGGLFTLLLLLFSVFSWVRFKRARHRTFERRSYFSFGAVSLALGLLMAVVSWGNVTSVVNPRQTLSGTPLSRIGETWLQSGSAQISPLLQRAIDERLAWQRPKAVICSVLLVAFVTLTVFLWRTLIRQSTTGEPFRKVSRRLMLCAGVLSAVSCLLLMLMVIGNTEGTFAPLFLTALYG